MFQASAFRQARAKKNPKLKLETLHGFMSPSKPSQALQGPTPLSGAWWLSRFLGRCVLSDFTVPLVLVSPWLGPLFFRTQELAVIVWWLVIFMMLPIGVRSQEEAGDVLEGSEPGAPVAPQLKQKAWWTTIITSGIWIIYYIITESGLAAQILPTDGSWG